MKNEMWFSSCRDNICNVCWLFLEKSGEVQEVGLLINLTVPTIPFRSITYENLKDLGTSEMHLKLTSKSLMSRCLQHLKSV